MNSALLYLIRLQSRGFVRRMTRGSASPRRAIFLAVGLGVVVLWLGQSLVMSAILRSTKPERMAAATIRFRAVAPLALLGICALTIVSSAGDKAVSFTPGEVDLLFPGPFSRRQLLLYKLAKSTLIALLTALLMSILMMMYAAWWPACYLGVLLTLLFIQFFSTAGVLLGQAVSQRAYSAFRKLAMVAALVLAAFFARKWLATGGGLAAVYELRSSDLGSAVLAPFDPFGRAITSRSSLELAGAAGEAALIDLGLLVVVLLLDANYIEAATAASRRRYSQIQRIRGGSILSAGVSGEVTWRLPRLPWAGGAGPVVWRQATSAARSTKGLLLLILVVALALGPLLASAIHSAEGFNSAVIGAIVWMTVLFSSMVKFDFRGDLDHMEELKALPLRPAALAVGQLVVPAVILTLAHLLVLCGVLLAASGHRGMLIVAACLAFPFNALLMAAENLIFLLFPTRPAAASPGDFQVLGRQAAQLVIKGLAVVVGATIAIAVAAPLYIVTGGSLVVLAVVAGAALLGETAALIPLIGRAFQRFDPSTDMPA